MITEIEDHKLLKNVFEKILQVDLEMQAITIHYFCTC